MQSRLAWALLGVVAIAFAWGIVELYDLRLGEGDMYPPYSSLRSDPLGAKVLFESMAQMPGYSAQRNFYGLDRVRDTNATILWLGEDAFEFASRPEEDLKEFEAAAARGERLVFAMRPVRQRPSFSNMQAKGAPLEKRWGIAFTYMPGAAVPYDPIADDVERSLPKQTALVMMLDGHAQPVIEKRIGKGAVVLVNSAYPFSNEALATGRDTDLLAAVLGPNHTIVFDEHHLGLSEESSLVMLARKYRLNGLGAGLLLLAILFIWRNSSSLLPPKTRTSPDEVQLAAGRDSASALQNLLRRNIPQTELIATCFAEWEKSRQGARSYSPDKMNAVRQLASSHGKAGRRPAIEVYRSLQSIISHKE